MVTRHRNYHAARSAEPNAAILRPLGNGDYLAFGSVEDARGHPSTQVNRKKEALMD